MSRNLGKIINHFSDKICQIVRTLGLRKQESSGQEWEVIQEEVAHGVLASA